MVEVVGSKTYDDYARLLAKHNIAAERFLDGRNSLKSDILPVLELRLWHLRPLDLLLVP